MFDELRRELANVQRLLEAERARRVEGRALEQESLRRRWRDDRADVASGEAPPATPAAAKGYTRNAEAGETPAAKGRGKGESYKGPP